MIGVFQNGTKAARSSKESCVYANDAASDHTVLNRRESITCARITKIIPSHRSPRTQYLTVACAQFLRFNAIILQR